MFTYKSQFSGKSYNVEIAEKIYRTNGSRALVMLDPNDTLPVAMITCNCPEVELKANEVVVKNYAENTGMLSFMVKNGLAIDTGRRADHHPEARVMKMTGKLINHLEHTGWRDPITTPSKINGKAEVG